jgi:hypothetical protein
MLFFSLTISKGQAQEEEILLSESILKSGEVVKLPVDCDTFLQIEFTAKNLEESESVFFYQKLCSEKKDTSKLPEKNQNYFTLGGKSSPQHLKIETIDCLDLNEIVFHVKTGKIHISIIGKTNAR